MNSIITLSHQKHNQKQKGNQRTFLHFLTFNVKILLFPSYMLSESKDGYAACNHVDVA